MIYINDTQHAIEQEQPLSELFCKMNIDIGKGIAVAVNNKVIPRAEWPTNIIYENDKIILIKATQGG